MNELGVKKRLKERVLADAGASGVENTSTEETTKE